MAQLCASTQTKIYDFSLLSELTQLRTVCIEDCGQIISLNSLKHSTDLEEALFIGDTYVEDGDWSDFLKLKKLKRFGIAHEGHYSPSAEELAEIFS